MIVKKRNGRLESYDPSRINIFVERCCEGIPNVYASEVITTAQLSFRDGIKTTEIDDTLELSARAKIWQEPNYTYVASRILLSSLYKEILKDKADIATLEVSYKKAFVSNIKKLVKAGVLSERALSFDLNRLAEALIISRDNIFKYPGIKNIYDRYLLKIDGKHVETPQAFYMRVAMGLSLNDKNPTERAIELYNVYSQHLASPSTPTLFNSLTIKSQLSSCYLSSIGDSIDGIFEGLWQEARKSKHAGGLGFHMGAIRASGGFIKGTQGISSGLVPWMKIYNDMLVGVDQGGRRKGSGCVYIEPWHLDVEEYLEVRRVVGEERRKCHDINTALWCPNLFFKRIEEDGEWTLFCPAQCPELHETYGEEFEKNYIEREAEFKNGKIKGKTLSAKGLWKEILKVLFESSHPWITFKDASCISYQNNHTGMLHGSNLCCVTGDQKVYTMQFGLRTVKEVSEFCKKYPEITELQVFGRKNIETATPIVKTLLSQDIYEVIVADGASHKITYDHPLWVKNRGWVECNKLKIGDEVETVISILDNPQIIYKKIIRIDKLVEKEDVYCLKVLSNEEKAWVCNGFITKNTEILIQTKAPTYNDGVKTQHGRTGVCTLSSLNLDKHVIDGKIDYELLKDSIYKVMRALDSVIDLNYYPTIESKIGATQGREVGLGTMGWYNVYTKLGIPLDSEEAIAFTSNLMEFISYHAINASADLAQELGSYPEFEGSSWSKGILPIDSRQDVMKALFQKDTDIPAQLDWSYLREKAKKGVRNGNMMAIAPTASISYITGCEQSIEPPFSLIFTYENKSGNIIVINEDFVNALKERKLWNRELAMKIKMAGGSIQEINEIPADIRNLYKGAYEIPADVLIRLNAQRQKWIDQAISFNLYNSGSSLKAISEMYLGAWRNGLKTTYYLRNKPASETSHIIVEQAKTCSINNPDCESCQ